jgi:DNA-binding IclR family transcriptional regulator
MAPQVGPRLPAYCTAIGKAVLAFLNRDLLQQYLDDNKLERMTSNTITDRKKLLKEMEEIRKSGFSVGREEFTFGRAGIGAPVFNKSGTIAGAISVAGNPQEILEERFDQLLTEVRATAAEISAMMGYYPMAVPVQIMS